MKKFGVGEIVGAILTIVGGVAAAVGGFVASSSQQERVYKETITEYAESHETKEEN